MEFERLARLGEQIPRPRTTDPAAELLARDPFPEIPQPTATDRLVKALRALALPLVLGLAIRLVLVPFTSWAKDDSVWWLAAANGVQHLGLYQRVGFSYPPLWGDLLQGMGWVLQHLGVHTSDLGRSDLRLETLAGANEFTTLVTTPLFNWCFKGILILFDLGVGLLVYELVRRATAREDRARLAFCLWFLNPFVILEGSVFGAADFIVGFTVLAAIVLFLSDRHVWAGVALGVAIMAKGSPAFVVPFLLFVAFDRGGDRVADRLRSAAPLAAGLVVGLGILTGPLVATGQLGAALSSVFARTGNALPGGFSVFGILGFRGLGSWSTALGNWSPFGVVILSLQVVGSIALGLIGARRARRDLTFATVSTVALVLVVVVMLGPVANAQYVLWFLPELIIMAVLWRRGLWSVIAYSLTAFVFVITLYGPGAFLFPLAARGTVSTHGLIQSIESWNNMAQQWWSSGIGSTNFEGPLTVLALTGLASVLRAALWSPVPRRRRLVAVFGASSGGVIPAVAITAAAALFGAGAVAATTTGGSVALSATASAAGSSVAATVRPGAGLESLRLVAFPVTTAHIPEQVDLYVDPTYPVDGTTQSSVANTASTVMNGLRLRGFHGTVRRIDAAGLRSVLLDSARAQNVAIVDMSGILPATVFSPGTDLVTPWLHSGGTLYWGGSAIGEFSGRPGQPDNQPSYPGSLGPAGVAHFFEPARVATALPDPNSVGAVPSAPARALTLDYRLNFAGPSLVPPDPGLTSVGWTSKGRGSIVRVSQGLGQLVLFGGLLYNQRLVAPDIETMIMSGLLWSDGPFSAVNVPKAVVDHGGVVRWSVSAPSAPDRTVFVAYDPSDAGLVFVHTLAPTP